MSMFQHLPAAFEVDAAACGDGFALEATEPELASSLDTSGDATDGSATSSAGPPGHEYQPQLGTPELIAQVRTLLATERRAERLICRYLADLADRVRQRQDVALDAYADELHAARCFFGLGVRDTRERVRIGRALRALPRLERAFIDGGLSYSRVREVTRVATAQTEHEWIDLAQRLDMRSLERRVMMANGPCIDDDGRNREKRSRQPAPGRPGTGRVDQRQHPARNLPALDRGLGLAGTSARGCPPRK